MWGSKFTVKDKERIGDVYSVRYSDGLFPMRIILVDVGGESDGKILRGKGITLDKSGERVDKKQRWEFDKGVIAYGYLGKISPPAGIDDPEEWAELLSLESIILWGKVKREVGGNSARDIFPERVGKELVPVKPVK